MIKYEDLKLIAETRLKEAKALCEKGLYDGAAYLCGYVVEISLKARICKHLNIDEYKDDGKEKNLFAIHSFDTLLMLAGLQKEVSLTKSEELFKNWSLLTEWKPEMRYGAIGAYDQAKVEALLRALEDESFGFYTWIKKYGRKNCKTYKKSQNRKRRFSFVYVMEGCFRGGKVDCHYQC